MLARSGKAELCTAARGCPASAGSDRSLRPASPGQCGGYLGPGAPQPLWTADLSSLQHFCLCPDRRLAPWSTPRLHSPARRAWSGYCVLPTSLPVVRLSPAGRDPPSRAYPLTAAHPGGFEQHPLPRVHTAHTGRNQRGSRRGREREPAGSGTFFPTFCNHHRLGSPLLAAPPATFFQKISCCHIKPFLSSSLTEAQGRLPSPRAM